MNNYICYTLYFNYNCIGSFYSFCYVIINNAYNLKDLTPRFGLKPAYVNEIQRIFLELS